MLTAEDLAQPVNVNMQNRIPAPSLSPFLPTSMTTSNLIASSITAILAMDESRLIGTNGGLPWHIPEDLKRFKELTMGHTVVM